MVKTVFYDVSDTQINCNVKIVDVNPNNENNELFFIMMYN